MRTHLLLAPCLAIGAMTACREAPPLPARATTLASHPHAMERLARLMRAEVTAPDPVPVERQIRCESRRVGLVLGSDFRIRLQWLADSLRTEFPSEAFDQLGQRLGRSPVPDADAASCRAIDAEAEAEVPLTAPSPVPGAPR